MRESESVGGTDHSYSLQLLIACFMIPILYDDLPINKNKTFIGILNVTET